MAQINIWSVLVSAVASLVIGSIWYGPLFGKMFMKEMEMDQWSEEKKASMKKKMGITYLVQFIASFVLIYYFAGVFTAGVNVGYQTLTVFGGMMTAFFVWLGFVVPIKIGDAIWGGNWKLFWLNIGNMLATLLVAGAIIGAWK